MGRKSDKIVSFQKIGVANKKTLCYNEGVDVKVIT